MHVNQRRFQRDRDVADHSERNFWDVDQLKMWERFDLESALWYSFLPSRKFTGAQLGCSRDGIPEWGGP